MNSLKRYSKYLSTSIIYFTFIFLLFFIFMYFQNSLGIINNKTFLNWDAMHYEHIAKNGYDHTRTAFFPLFPMFWKVIQVKPIAIGLLNFSLYLLSVSWLLQKLEVKKLNQLFLLSIPGVIFFILPYAEAFFFVGGVITLVGLKNKNIAFISLGLLMCSLTRPTTFILIPAIVLTIFLSGHNEKNNSIKSKSLQAFYYTFLLLVGLSLSFTIHKYYTGEWLNFFESQNDWGNKLRIPQLPISTWGGDNINRYDASALFIGVSCAVLILIITFSAKVRAKLNIPAYVLFSMLYLAGTAGVVLLFRGGLLFSLNRFIYSTPFILVTLYHLITHFEFNYKKIGILFFVSTLFWLLFASYNHIHNFLCFSIVSLIFSTILLMNNKNKYIATIATLVIVVINNIVAYKLLMKFLSGYWVA